MMHKHRNREIQDWKRPQEILSLFHLLKERIKHACVILDRCLLE